MKTAIIIPNWNGAGMIAECLESLRKQTLQTDIIVVDNGSTDDSVKIIEEQFPDVQLIKLAANAGFAGGVNAGIRRALDGGAEAVALFNNDAVAEPHWLRELTDSLQGHPKVGITTGKLLRSDGKHIDSTGDFYSTWGMPFPRGRNQLDDGSYDKAESVFGASGGASLYRAAMLDQIGLFDERFFAYYEDVDLSFRARLAGWDVFYVPGSRAYHHVGATSSKLGDFTRYHSIKNFLLLYTKNMPAWLYWKYLPFFLYQFARTTARSVIDVKPHVWLRSVGTFAGLLPGVLQDRRQIQKNRKLSALEVERLLYKGRPPKIPML